MTTLAIDRPLFLDTDDPHPAQWRLSRIEVINWGTFQGRHVVDIARKGHLITGHSGSGKSSLLDAIATVMTPKKWLRYNDAAQDVSSRAEDRSLVSYVRGAWSRQTDEETGEGVSQYLRSGATWSAIALRFASGSTTPAVTLVRLFHIRRGSNSSTDLRELHIVVRGDVDAKDFEPFTKNGIDVRKIKAAWPDAHVTDQHSVFAARFVRLLEIGKTEALQLLQKTQSAKNLGSLDQLFRGFMLDVPKTFAFADTAVQEFGALAEAHHIVIEARRQADHLRRLREPGIAFTDAQAAAASSDHLLEALDDYRDRRLLQLDRDDRERLRRDQATAEQAASTAHEAADRARQERTAADVRVQSVGGADLQAQELRLAQSTTDAERIATQIERQAMALHSVDLEMPSTAADYEELRAVAAAERSSLANSLAESRSQVDVLHEVRAAA